ncbi:hypothetical protein EON65_27180 [archaeon]|nr:MAG: hypothetical protein EON65_27180 [archaeon]
MKFWRRLLQTKYLTYHLQQQKERLNGPTKDVLDLTDVMSAVLRDWLPQNSKAHIYFLSALPKHKTAHMHTMARAICLSQPFADRKRQWKRYESDIYQWLVAVQASELVGDWRVSSASWKLLTVSLDKVHKFTFSRLQALTIGPSCRYSVEICVLDCLQHCPVLHTLKLLGLHAQLTDSNSSLISTMYSAITNKPKKSNMFKPAVRLALHALYLVECKINQQVMDLFAQSCPTLDTVYASNTDFPKLSAAQAVKYQSFFNKIRAFNFHGSDYVHYFTEQNTLEEVSCYFFPPSTHLKLFLQLLQVSENVQSLRLGNFHLSSSFAISTTFFLPSLSTLTLSNAETSVTFEAIHLFAQCPNLINVNYIGCGQYFPYIGLLASEQLVCLPYFNRMRSFSLDRVYQLDHALLSHFPESSLNLSELKINHSIMLSNCTAELLPFFARCTLLHSLYLDTCNFHFPAFLRTIRTSCTQLRKLTLHDCEHMGGSWVDDEEEYFLHPVFQNHANASQVEYLYLRCPNIEDSRLVFLMKALGCQRTLKEFVLCDCDLLTLDFYASLTVHASALTSLSLDCIKRSRAKYIPEQIAEIKQAVSFVQHVNVVMWADWIHEQHKMHAPESKTLL